MATRNDVTGDSLVSKVSSEAYKANWDAIFGKKKEAPKVDEPKVEQPKQPNRICGGY